MIIKPEWEEIAEHTRRMKVWGGWIVDTWVNNDVSQPISVSCCFVPDSEYKWEIK